MGKVLVGKQKSADKHAWKLFENESERACHKTKYLWTGKVTQGVREEHWLYLLAPIIQLAVADSDKVSLSNIYM